MTPLSISTCPMLNSGSRFLGGRPVLAALVVAQVEIAAADVEGDVVIAIPRDPAQTRVAVEGIASGGIGNDSEIFLASQIVDPWQGRMWPGNDVFPIVVVEVTVLHRIALRRVGHARPYRRSIIS